MDENNRNRLSLEHNAPVYTEFGRRIMEGGDPFDGLQYLGPWGWREYNSRFIPTWDGGTAYRYTQNAVAINGHEVPKPLTAAPGDGDLYHIASPTSPDYYSEARWRLRHDIGWRLLDRGLVHRTAEDAAAHGKALVSFTRTGGKHGREQ